MIIYGWKEKWLKTEFLIEQCPNCNTTNSLQLHLFQRYAHIFWIPTFPYSKNGATQCAHCGQVVNYKHLSPSLRLSYDNLKSSAKAPIWMYSGLGLIVAIAIAITLSGQLRARRVSEMVLQPRVNDILEIRQTGGYYTLIKLYDVTKDSIYFNPNKFQTDKSSGLSELYTKGFDTLDYAMPRSTLIDMNEKSEIIDITRK